MASSLRLTPTLVEEHTKPMTKSIKPILRFQSAAPEALIQFDNEALRFIVNGITVFRLTPDGMEYKGQIVEDAGVAYRELTNFFSASKEIMNRQATSQKDFDG